MPIPVAFTVNELVEYFWEIGSPSAEDLRTACSRLGRNGAPALLADLHAEGLLTPDAASATIADAWSLAEYPDSYLDRAVWRQLFALAGYVINGDRAERPDAPVQLFRGSVTERRTDWSWTDSREVAERYASGDYYQRPKSHLWTAQVEPWRLLGRNTGREEHEYIVDTDGLLISEAT